MNLEELVKMPWVQQKADEFVATHAKRFMGYLHREQWEIKAAFLAGIRGAEGPDRANRFAKNRLQGRWSANFGAEAIRIKTFLKDSYRAGRNLITHERPNCCSTCTLFEV